jgi:hypothetical protein
MIFNIYCASNGVNKAYIMNYVGNSKISLQLAG